MLGMPSVSDIHIFTQMSLSIDCSLTKMFTSVMQNNSCETLVNDEEGLCVSKALCATISTCYPEK
jgi:hypothetical protein